MSDTLVPQWFWESDPFTRQTDRAERLLETLNKQTAHHATHCDEYGRVLRAVYPQIGMAQRLEDVPYLPVGLFKQLNLMSRPPDQIHRVLRSSGTTSDQASKIFLDLDTARAQSLALARIMTSVLGPSRRPMVIIDAKPGQGVDGEMSARHAAVLGLMPFGRDHLFALQGDLTPDFDALEAWSNARSDASPFLFGFTFLVWQWANGLKRPLPFSDGVLLHGGGWKKMEDRAVSREEFRRTLQERVGIRRIHDYYGLVEQVGSIHLECEQGFFHTPIFADVLIRDPHDWTTVPDGRSGVIEVLSVLPWSYPGHAILTEDIGVVHGRDDCNCGRGGTRFKVMGRVPRTMLRGCSDARVA